MYKLFGRKILFFTILAMSILLIQISNTYAVSFADHTGYTPDWAQSMGTYQALARCDGIIGEQTTDGNWCMEWVSSVIGKGQTGFNPQPQPSYSSSSQQLYLIPSKSELIQFLPTLEDEPSYHSSQVMGLNSSNPIQQTLSNLGVVDMVSQSFWREGSNDTLTITAMVTKFNSNDSANNFYDKKIANAKENMDTRFSWIDNTSPDSDIPCTGIITSINLEPNNPNNNSQNTEWYCVVDNLVVYAHGDLNWQQSGESGPLLPDDTQDFASIMVNKIVEKLHPNLSAKLPDEVKKLTRSFTEGNMPARDFFKKIQQLLDNGQMVIPAPDPSLFNGSTPDNSSGTRFFLFMGLDNWSHGINNETQGIFAWQYAIFNGFLTQKLPSQVSSELQTPDVIPQWIKNNAKWWSEGQVGDSDFIKGIEYLVQNGIIQIPQIHSSSNSGSQQIPQWVKNTAGWWAEGTVDDSEFLKGIGYLVQAGIIQVNPSQKENQKEGLPSQSDQTSQSSYMIPTSCTAMDNGILPDPNCTPGAVDPRVTQDNIDSTICVSGYSSTVRPPVSYTEPLKFKLMDAYGYIDSPSRYELDHLIPLELGGAPMDTRNLWPEPHSSSYTKDGFENYLHEQVCSGDMSLQEVQKEISTNWHYYWKASKN